MAVASEEGSYHPVDFGGLLQLATYPGLKRSQSRDAGDLSKARKASRSRKQDWMYTSSFVEGLHNIKARPNPLEDNQSGTGQ